MGNSFILVLFLYAFEFFVTLGPFDVYVQRPKSVHQSQREWGVIHKFGFFNISLHDKEKAILTTIPIP